MNRTSKNSKGSVLVITVFVMLIVIVTVEIMFLLTNEKITKYSNNNIHTYEKIGMDVYLRDRIFELRKSNGLFTIGEIDEAYLDGDYIVLVKDDIEQYRLITENNGNIIHITNGKFWMYYELGNESSERVIKRCFEENMEIRK